MKQMCQKCKGDGKMKGVFPVYASHVPEEDRKQVVELVCCYCFGRKWENTQWVKDGEELRQKRIDAKLTLRDASKFLNVKVSLLGYMEKGSVPPDMDISYEQYSKVIIVKENDEV